MENRKDESINNHPIATEEQWLVKRIELLNAEKELTRQSDRVAAMRQALPWVKIEKDYQFDTEQGKASLSDLFCGRSQLMIYHFMFGPDYEAGCPSCSSIADGFNGFAVHLAHHDVMLMAVSRAPLDKLLAYKKRMNWDFPWASSYNSDFNYDFKVSFTAEQQQLGLVDVNYREGNVTSRRYEIDPKDQAPEAGKKISATTGTDWSTYIRENPGMSTFVLREGIVYHAYSTYERGVDGLWGMYQWLDRAPLGRNEGGDGVWFRRHDEYPRDQQLKNDNKNCCS